jgi:peptidyl-prolyl cis-trans isomerase SurA
VLKQIYAQLVWNKVLTLKVRPKITVSQFEIEQAVKSAASKEMDVNLKQILIPITSLSAAEVERKAEGLNALRPRVQACADFDTVAQDAGSAIPPDLITLPLKNVHPKLYDMVATLPIGQVSPLVKTDSALLMIIVCGRSEAAVDISKEQAAEMVAQKKMELQARRYVRDLRKNTLIEVRL